MANVRVLRRQEKAYIELPSAIAGYDELELFMLKEGYYLITVPLGVHAPQQTLEKGRLSEAEIAIMKKLLSIRFENRTPEYVGKALSESEMKTLHGLEQRGMVNVFRGTKYKDGVYNISDHIYPLLQKSQGAPSTDAPAEIKPQATSPRGAAPGSQTGAMLQSQGFIIIQDKREAMMLSEGLGPQMKSGAVVGVKGFDGKFYIVTREYYSKARALIDAALKGQMDAPSVASATRLDPEGCLAVLRLMAENGDIIEKKKGIFAPV
ncbi:MAG: hypothetical protein V1861_06875 [Candidatus Micrarchaeota archaeon]